MWGEIIALVFILLGVWWFIILIYDKYKLNKLKEEYNVQENKSKPVRAEGLGINTRTFESEGIGRDGEFDESESIPEEPTQYERRSILQNDDGFRIGRNEPINKGNGSSNSRADSAIRRKFRIR